MANRDYDDRDGDRGREGGFGRDDRERHGRDHGQGNRFDERGGGFDRRDQWVGSGGNHGSGGGSGGGEAGQGFSRGGMSPGGGAYGRGERGRGDQDRSRGDMGSANLGQGRGYDNFGGGAFRAGAEFAGGQGGRDQGGRDQGGRDQGPGQDYREAEERQGRPRGAMGGAFGSGGDWDYGDYRTDRDRSLLGEMGSMLGFGARRGEDRQGHRQEAGQATRPEHRQEGGHGQGYRQDPGQGVRRGMGPRNYVRSDARIEEDVNERLSHGHLDATDVEVKVEGGEVTLSGTVRSRGDKRLAEDLADDVGGVRHVQNNLRVQDNWTAGGSAPGFGGGTSGGAGSRAAGGSMEASSGGPVVGDVGSATNVTTGQDPSQMAGQSPGQSSADSGNAGHSGQPGAKDEPGKL